MTKKNHAILLIILSAICFSSMSLFVKLVPNVPSMEKAFFRNVVSLIISFSLIIKLLLPKLKNKEFAEVGKFFVPKNPLLLFVRVFFGTCGVIINFYVIDKLILSDATILTKTSPFFTIIFSYFLLKERITRQQIFAIITAFIGCIFVIKPGLNVVIVPYLLAITCAVFAGIAYTCLRMLGNRGENGNLIIFSFSVFSTIIVLPFMLMVYIPLDLHDLIFILIYSILATGGQLCITKAYSLAAAKNISIFDYFQVLFASIYGLIFFGVLPDVLNFIGYAIIIYASIYLYMKNKT